MKVSVSLPGDDVEFLDEYARVQGIVSRSAVLHTAIRLLKASRLSADYESAWDEWVVTDQARLWESTAGDGLPTSGASV